MKKLRMLLPTGAVIGMLVVGTAFPAMAAADSDTAKFVRGTTINAVDVSKQTAQQAKGYLEGYFNEHYEIKIQDADGNLEVLKGTDVGYHLNVTGSVDDILKEQNDTGRKTGPGSDQSYTVTVEATLDDGKLAAALANVAMHRAMQLKDVLRARHLVKTVDILRHHGIELARCLQLGELGVRAIGLCVERNHLLAIKIVEVRLMGHKERM